MNNVVAAHSNNLEAADALITERRDTNSFNESSNNTTNMQAYNAAQAQLL